MVLKWIEVLAQLAELVNLFLHVSLPLALGLIGVLGLIAFVLTRS